MAPSLLYCLLFMRLMCVCTREYDANWLWIINGLKNDCDRKQYCEIVSIYNLFGYCSFLLFIYNRTLHIIHRRKVTSTYTSDSRIQNIVVNHKNKNNNNTIKKRTTDFCASYYYSNEQWTTTQQVVIIISQ